VSLRGTGWKKTVGRVPKTPPEPRAERCRSVLQSVAEYWNASRPRRHPATRGS